METKLKQEPVADGGGLPPLEKGWREQLREFREEAFEELRQENISIKAQLASSQEALRAAREENERLKRTVNLVAGGAAQGVMLHSKITNAYLAGKRESENYFEERMQQAVLELKRCDLNDPMHNPFEVIQIRKAIKLLSPEGSSR